MGDAPSCTRRYSCLCASNQMRRTQKQGEAFGRFNTMGQLETSSVAHLSRNVTKHSRRYSSSLRTCTGATASSDRQSVAVVRFQARKYVMGQQSIVNAKETTF